MEPPDKPSAPPDSATESIAWLRDRVIELEARQNSMAEQLERYEQERRELRRRLQRLLEKLGG